MTARHVGIVSITPEYLSNMLGFPEGTVLNAFADQDRLAIRFIIEHPDMPKTEDGYMLSDVSPTYRQVTVYVRT